MWLIRLKPTRNLPKSKSVILENESNSTLLWSMIYANLYASAKYQQPSRSRTAAIVRLYTLKLTHNLAWPKRHALEVWIGSFSSSIDIEKGTHCEMQHFGSRRRRGSSNSRSLFHDSCRWASYVSVLPPTTNTNWRWRVPGPRPTCLRDFKVWLDYLQIREGKKE